MKPIRLATRMERMKPSAVREILKVAEKPEIISFAGGLPAPELFPCDAIARAHESVLTKEPAAALQYGVTEGFLPLREWIAQRMSKKGVPTTPGNLLVTNGSQQGLDLVARLLLDPGDTVLVESPTYLAALQAFGAYEVGFAEVEGDENGILLGSLERAIREYQPKMLYVIPNFQNPTGTTLAADRREKVVSLCAAHGVVILEDDPYGELRFRGEFVPSLAAHAEDATVLQLGTFSKTLAPGMRIGWINGPVELVKKLTILKQAADLHTGTLSQRVVARLLETFDFEAHLATLRRVYGERRDTMIQALERHMPKGARWTSPEGGLFLWMQLPDGVQDEAFFHRAVQHGVAVVPGAGFFADGDRHEFVRLNYSNQTQERILEGVRRLGHAAREASRSAAPAFAHAGK